jgi:hypothetical protein
MLYKMVLQQTRFTYEKNPSLPVPLVAPPEEKRDVGRFELPQLPVLGEHAITPDSHSVRWWSWAIYACDVVAIQGSTQWLHTRRHSPLYPCTLLTSHCGVCTLYVAQVAVLALHGTPPPHSTGPHPDDVAGGGARPPWDSTSSLHGTPP